MPRAGVLILLACFLAGGMLPSEARKSERHTERQVRMATTYLPMPVQLYNINERDRQLRAQVRSQLQTGQLTPAQSQSIIVMLDQIKATQENYLSDCELTQTESNALAAALGSVTSQLNASINSPTTRLNPSAMGFNMPNMGYPRGMSTRGRDIASVAPWWMF